MITVGEDQLYAMLCIYFGVGNWTPDNDEIAKAVRALGDLLMLGGATRQAGRARFEANVAGRRDYIARGGKL